MTDPDNNDIPNETEPIQEEGGKTESAEKKDANQNDDQKSCP